MSFILDALKKSELERQRQAVPGLMDSRPLPPRAKFPLWAVALVALLLVNLGVIAVVLMRGGAQVAAGGPSPASLPVTAQAPPVTASPAAAPATAPMSASQGPSATDHFSPMDAPHPSDAAPPVYAPEIPPTQDYPSPRSARRAADPVLTDSSPADSEVLPSLNEINLAGRPALANLHLDVHVYATKPSERFVYINMRKYREGATLAEGPVLERIRRDGVVLNYQGLRFVLPRQQ
jgi:general secretion pathway protein B